MDDFTACPARATPTRSPGSGSTPIRLSLLPAQILNQQWHRPPSRPLLRPRKPGGPRNIQMRPVVLLGKPRQEARRSDGASTRPADVGDVREVAGQQALVLVPQRQLPGEVQRVLADLQQV